MSTHCAPLLSIPDDVIVGVQKKWNFIFGSSVKITVVHSSEEKRRREENRLQVEEQHEEDALLGYSVIWTLDIPCASYWNFKDF
ncbi:uncharacterized [Tachysurus ichikawai]